MKLQKHEYGLGLLPTKSGFDHSIVIAKTALEKWLAYYHEEVEKFRKKEQWDMMLMYDSRAGLLEDILKHFEED